MLTKERLYAIKKTNKVRKENYSTKSQGNKESYSYIWDKAMDMI